MTEADPNSQVDVNDPETWNTAKRYADLAGPVPSSVSHSIASLWEDHLLSQQKGDLCISSKSLAIVKRVEKSSVLRMPLFFAAQALYSDRMSDVREDDMTHALVRVLYPGMFASLLGLVYLHRRFNKICVGDDTWGALSKEYILNMELGFLMGKEAPELGEAVGVLIGGLRIAALATFLKRDKEGFVAYRQAKQKKFDVEYEHQRWGCDHGQVAAYLLRNLGITLDPMQMTYAIRGFELERISPDLRSWRALSMLIDTFKKGQMLSELDLAQLEINLSPDSTNAMQANLQKLVESGSTFNWMFKGSKSEPE